MGLDGRAGDDSQLHGLGAGIAIAFAEIRESAIDFMGKEGKRFGFHLPRLSIAVGQNLFTR